MPRILPLLMTFVVMSSVSCVGSSPEVRARGGQGVNQADLAAEPKAMGELPEQAALEGLEKHAVHGKVTIFDFYSEWCQLCTLVDGHLRQRLTETDHFVVRKIKVEGWEGPLVKRYLKHVDALPLLVVYSPTGEKMGELVGGDLEEIDAMVDGASYGKPERAEHPKERARYHVTVSVGAVHAGGQSFATVEVVAGDGFKINQEYPWKAAVTATEGLVYLERSYPAPRWQFAAHRATLPVSFIAQVQGSYQGRASLDFSVCNESTCEVIQDYALDWKVEAK